MQQNNLIVRPVISEKSMRDADAGKFTFVFAKQARKEGIRKTIEQLFSVHVVSLSTSIVKGGRKKTGKQRIEGKTPAWKRAIVTLQKGEKITMFDIGEEK